MHHNTIYSTSKLQGTEMQEISIKKMTSQDVPFEYKFTVGFTSTGKTLISPNQEITILECSENLFEHSKEMLVGINHDTNKTTAMIDGQYYEILPQTSTKLFSYISVFADAYQKKKQRAVGQPPAPKSDNQLLECDDGS